MKNRFVNSICKHWDVIAVFVVMAAIFTFMMFTFREKTTDMFEHAYAVWKKVAVEGTHMFSGNFILYFTVNLLTLFSGNQLAIAIVFPLFIALCNTAKYVVVRNAFALEVEQRWARMAAAALLFVYIFPLLYLFGGIWPEIDNMLLGYIVPNVWHNSTVLCMMPFAIVVYLLSLKQLEHYDAKRNIYIGLALIVSILIKPSFYFVYGVVFPVIYWIRYRFSKEFWHLMLPIFIGVFFVLYEYLTIFLLYPSNEGDGVVISLSRLAVWSFWKIRWQTWLVSLLFPILFVILYKKEIRRDLEFYALVGMLAVAVGIFLLCAETGIRASHGNFAWQMYIAMWFIYYYILKVIIRNVQHIYPRLAGVKWHGIAKREKLMIGLYLFHVACGIWYLIRYLITQNYY